MQKTFDASALESKFDQLLDGIINIKENALEDIGLHFKYIIGKTFYRLY